MKCPNCESDGDFSLVETADDYQDGYVECNCCGKNIADFKITFNKEEVQNA